YLAVLPTITPEICQDKAAPGKPSDCPLYSHLCYDPIYAELMKDQCIKTCGFVIVKYQQHLHHVILIILQSYSYIILSIN
ncbi:hypothetical protein WUBG_18384, partial [Wuchereria bancrofti]